MSTTGALMTPAFLQSCSCLASGFETFPIRQVFILVVDNNTHGLNKLKTLCTFA